MDQNQTLFNSTFKDLGGLHILNSHDEHDISFCLHREMKAQVMVAKQFNCNLPEIVIDLFKNDEMCAQCRLINGTYFIGISHGTLLLLHNYFCRMLCHEKVFPHYPSDADQTFPEQLKEFPISNVDRLLDFSFDFPKSRERMELAYHLSASAVGYIVDHEIGHISYGHLAYIASGALIDKYDKHSMEMSADSFAIARAVRFLVTMDSNGASRRPDAVYHFGDLKKAIFNSLFSIYFLKRLMKWRDSPTHPDARIRAYTVLNVGIQALEKIAQLSIEDGRQLLFGSFHAVEEAIGIITGQGFNGSYLKLLQEKDLYLKDSVLLLRTFNTLRPQLEKFKFTELPEKYATGE